jgi:hypothetical protein
MVGSNHSIGLLVEILCRLINNFGLGFLCILVICLVARLLCLNLVLLYCIAFLSIVEIQFLNRLVG